MTDQQNFEDESFDLDELKAASVESSFLFLHDGEKVSDPSSLSIKKYDFTNPIVLSDADLSLLKTKSEQFVYYLGNCHIYDDHIEKLREQSLREPLPFPTLDIVKRHDNIEDYEMSDFVLNDYQSHKPIKMDMRK